MMDFKPKKGRATVRALSAEAVQNTDSVIEVIATKYPGAAGFLVALKAGLGMRIAYKQDLLNQFTEFLMEHPEVFSAQELNSPELQDGMLIAIEDYFKLRTTEKRLLAQNIFLDFGRSHNKPLYPLERYDDTLHKLSHSGIRLLGFISNDIEKFKTNRVQQKLGPRSSAADKAEYDRLKGIHLSSKDLGYWVEEYIKAKAYNEAPKHAGYTYISETEAIENPLRKDIELGINELEQLGLIRFFIRPSGWGPQDSGYNLTDYGKKFISIIKPGP